MLERPELPLSPTQIRELIGLEPADIQELSFSMQAEVYADLGEKFPDLLAERLKAVEPNPKIQRAMATALGYELVFGQSTAEKYSGTLEENAQLAIDELTKILGRRPSLSEIAREFNITKSHMQKVAGKIGYKSGRTNRLGG